MSLVINPRLWCLMDVTDAGCREFFVIDGDSLLAHFICNPQRNKLITAGDNHREMPWPDFYSRLQVIWLAERFLLELIQRNCIFDIVFFESNSVVWINEFNQSATCQVLTMRKIFIEHLQQYFHKSNSQQPIGRQLHHFSRCFTEEWKAYCERTGPRFILMSTGICEKNTKLWCQLTDVWRATALGLLKRGTCAVVRFDDLHFLGNRIMGYIASASNYCRLTINTTDADTVLAFLEQVEVEKAKLIGAEQGSSSSGQELPEMKNSASTNLLVASLKHFMTKIRPISGLQFSIYVCLQHFVALTLPLKKRVAISSAYSSLVYDQSAMIFMKGLIHKFYVSIYYVLESLNIQNEDWKNDLANFFDETFALTLLVHLHTIHTTNYTLKDVVGSTSYAMASKLSRHICHSSEEDIIKQLDINFLYCDSIQELILGKSCRPSNKGRLFVNKLFNEILAPVNKLKLFEEVLRILSSSSNSLSDERDDADDDDAVLYYENQHWHCERELESGGSSNQTNQRYPLTSLTVLPRARIVNRAAKELDLLRSRVDGEQTIERKIEHIEDALLHNSDLLEDELKTTCARLMKLELLESWLCQEVLTENYNKVCQIKVEAFCTIKETLHNLPKTGTPEHEEAMPILTNCLRRFGFNQCAHAILPSEVMQGDKKDHGNTNFTFHSELEGADFLDYLAFPSDPEFQMRFCGHLFQRTSVNRHPDKRISFIPDSWQKELLDVIDANESALVCAPTSSGKTFISFYAMEKVLKSADTSDLLVYVAPTKAIVNQVAKEMISRYGETPIGIFTRDFRERVYTCKILICVPQMLEILLLSPVSCDCWIPRLKRIIFDEVHSINERSNGVVWEHILLMAPCPILALSASVTNFEQLYDWLKETQRRKNINLRMITSHRRYCELRKWIYLPEFGNGRAEVRRDNNNKRDEAQSLKNWANIAYQTSEVIGNMVRINPFAGMSPNVIEHSGFPCNFKLLPDECVEIYSMLQKACRENNVQPTPSLEQLDPAKFFEKCSFLSRDESERYEEQLKTLIKEWCGDKSVQTGSSFSKNEIVSYVADELTAKIKQVTSCSLEEPLDCTLSASEFPHLLENLNKHNFLPAIVFCLERRGCETLAMSASGVCKKRKLRQGTGKADELIREAIKTLKPHITRNLEFLLEALKIGIGVHHAGLPARYRLCVENLFNQKALAVVIATGTLACGINTPCRTVVFAMDNMYLDSINHLQMMGRAGRRGYDLTGNVVYFGLSYQRVKQLLCWPLQPVVANFPVSCSLVLRTLCLETQFCEQRHVSSAAVLLMQARIKELFNNSFYSNGRVIPHMQILHMVDFAVDYFRRKNIIRSDGHLINLAGMITHSFYTEPSNLIFAALISSGKLQSALEEYQDTTIQSKAGYFLELFASFFNRIKIKEKDVDTQSGAMIVLPKLPNRILKFIETYNNDVLTLLADCMSHYAGSYLSCASDSQLPLSEIDFNHNDVNNDSHVTIGLNNPNDGYVRSLFSSISGNKWDAFTNSHDIAAHRRAGIFIDETAIPAFEIFDERLNAYIVDFASHGDMVRIDLENHVKAGHVYDMLYDAELLLTAVSVSLGRIAKESPKYGSIAEIAVEAAKMLKSKMEPYHATMRA